MYFVAIMSKTIWALSIVFAFGVYIQNIIYVIYKRLEKSVNYYKVQIIFRLFAVLQLLYHYVQFCATPTKSNQLPPLKKAFRDTMIYLDNRFLPDLDQYQVRSDPSSIYLTRQQLLKADESRINIKMLVRSQNARKPVKTAFNQAVTEFKSVQHSNTHKKPKIAKLKHTKQTLANTLESLESSENASPTNHTQAHTPKYLKPKPQRHKLIQKHEPLEMTFVLPEKQFIDFKKVKKAPRKVPEKIEELEIVPAVSPVKKKFGRKGYQSAVE
ncbi:Hypothetical_protein [Hexamita inflata]|uniref:Hypothetical_protein n=1 Tax=Hexamita inflata TaxID=28002 RepID=A0AA86P8P6_9EUKA|nr:Hypothetical protein HINF_LOCUS16346 [Hexamita inflata]CAI9933863.1 Hypothetical protein HINF_LOCUS21508 [Hexamita inflata]